MMIFNSQSPILVLFDMILIVLIFYFLYPAQKYKEELSQRRLNYGLVCIFLFSIFSFWGTDWFHYQEIYDIYKAHPNYRISLEPVYQFIITYLCPSYIVFRIIVWGVALLLSWLTIKRMQLNVSLACFLFGTMFMLYFSYARVSLAITMIMYGISLLYAPGDVNKKLIQFIGIVFIIASIFFHKSAILCVVAVAVSFITKTEKKNSWFYLILIFGVLPFIFQGILSSLLSMDVDDADGQMTDALMSGKGYLNRSQQNGISAIGTLIGFCFERTSYFMMAFLSYKLQTEYEIPEHIKIVAKINFYIVLIATVFAFDLGFNTMIIFGRMLRFSLLPSTIILTYIIQYGLYTKWVKYSIIVLCCNVSVNLLYCFYDTMVNY